MIQSGNGFVACGRRERDCPCWVSGTSDAECVDKPHGSEDSENCMFCGFYLDQLIAEDARRAGGE